MFTKNIWRKVPGFPIRSALFSADSRNPWLDYQFETWVASPASSVRFSFSAHFRYQISLCLWTMDPIQEKNREYLVSPVFNKWSKTRLKMPLNCKFLTNLKNYGLWTNLNKFELICTILNKFRPILKSLLWTSWDQFEQE